MELIVHFCDEKRPDRNNEYLTCLRKNLDHPAVTKVHILKLKTAILHDEIIENDKAQISEVEHRPTFAELFDYANANIKHTVAGIINLDIMLDVSSDWFEAHKVLVMNKTMVLALSRFEYSPERGVFTDPQLDNFNYATAQDGWFFKTPINVENVNFEIGTMGADNALADRLKKAGYYPMNLGSRYKIFHYDQSRGKNAANANQIHMKDSSDFNSVYSRYPEKDGYLLLPDFDRSTNIDAFLDRIGVDQGTKYTILCDLLSRMVIINNVLS